MKTMGPCQFDYRLEVSQSGRWISASPDAPDFPMIREDHPAVEIIPVFLVRPGLDALVNQ